MTHEELNKLRNFFSYHVEGLTIKSNIDFIDIQLECLSDFVLHSNTYEINSNHKADAKILLQMVMSKILSLKKLIQGINYKKDGKDFFVDDFFDPTVIANLIRNLYETICTFNLIFIQPNDDEVREVIYNLWVIAGLKYRQRFKVIITTEENKKKAEMESKTIKHLETSILESSIYKSMNEKNKRKILYKINSRDFKVQIVNNNVSFLTWQEIGHELVSNENMLFREMYGYFSMYTHPSQVSVFQFSQMFGEKGKEYKNMTIFNLRYCHFLSSIFIADFIKVFPESYPIFEKLPVIKQAIINFYNKMIRGEKYSINDSLSILK